MKIRNILALFAIAATVGTGTAAKDIDGARPSTPINLSEWITQDDYPKGAAVEGAQGEVAFVLTIDPTGRVSDCQIRKSSGRLDLDQATCIAIRSRAQFNPATDNSGKPVNGSYAGRIFWQLPDERPFMPPPNGTATMTVVVEKDGSISDCRVESDGGFGAPPNLCDRVPPFGVMVGEDGQPVRVRVISTQSVRSEIIAD